MLYRNLREEEIVLLKKQNCRSLDGWDKIQVTDNFIASNIKDVVFSGINCLGLFTERINLPSGVSDMAGIYNAHIHNCIVNDQCFIKNIGTSVSNYFVGEGAIIQNVATLIVEGESSFGNGIEVAAINEGGGREVLMYDELSVHTAYMMAFYRYRPKLITSLQQSIRSYVNRVSSSQGRIGEKAVLVNCGNLKNIIVGNSAHLSGVTLLNNGSVNSSAEAPVYIGEGVNAQNFIVSSGSRVSDGVYLRQCFVGQGCEISNSFTADNSLFFSNSQCLQGEACSIFAGPYTVTHHKSTLLIAGYYSFFNAGSGTNQSNHMYKLGPVHQGTIERGGRTGSNAYVLWPAQIGAFTMLLGNHYSNTDTTSLPFSYLIEDNGKSVLIPGQNLFNVGTVRDVKKWPNRDNRKGTHRLDYLVKDALNPYTIDKITEGIRVLEELRQKVKAEARHIMYKNIQMSPSSIQRGIKLYEQALIKYVGDVLVELLERDDFLSKRADFSPDNHVWLDVAGLIVNSASLENWMGAVEGNKIEINQWNSFFKSEAEAYPSLKQAHALQILQSYFSIDIASCGSTEIINFLERWIDSNNKIKSAILLDAKKEFNVKSKTGYGRDGEHIMKDIDFEAIRGTMSANSFVQEIELEYEKDNQKARQLIARLGR
ncbi:protein of unknown function [Saccharicrinis carchari]|uniref:DUF4954 domain-containing protein n=1 Tax=Saccharicrinis carchari TaxID=1168039 RepID=A0A521CSE9_SACCC|nr:DUF4954 family protein [Saccharicrinis carchari]SMO62394.1 protein of unknown function [Saccharicrinis carchari]